MPCLYYFQVILSYPITNFFHRTPWYGQLLTYYFSFSTISPVKNLSPPSHLLMAPPVTSLAIPQDQIVHHSISSRPSSISPTKISTHKCSIVCVDEGGDLDCLENFMQFCFDYEVIVETTGCSSLSIKSKVKNTHQTIDNMVNIQLISCGNNDDIVCFCYQ